MCRFGGQAGIVFVGLSCQSRRSRVVADERVIGLLLRPCVPSCAFTRHAVEADAIDGAGGNAQLASGARGLNDGMHRLVRANDGIHGACLDAKRATNAPVLIDDGDGEGALVAILWVERQQGLCGDGREACHPSVTAGWALVDGRFTRIDRLGIREAVRVATTRALRLWQCAVDGFSAGADDG